MKVWCAGWRTDSQEELKPLLFTMWSQAQYYLLAELEWLTEDVSTTFFDDAYSSLKTAPSNSPWDFSNGSVEFFIREWKQDATR